MRQPCRLCDKACLSKTQVCSIAQALFATLAPSVDTNGLRYTGRHTRPCGCDTRTPVFAD
jgi:hypothetical protein